MQHPVKKSWPLLIVLLSVVVLGAWQSSPLPPTPPQQPSLADTVPNRNMKIKDIDEAIQQLDKSEAAIEKSMKDISIPPVPPIPPVDMEKMKADVKEAMKSVDAKQMKADIEKAMKSIDMEKVKLDMEKAKLDMQKAVQQIDVAKIKAETDAAIAKVDWQKMQKEMDKVQAEMPKIQAQLQELKPQIEKSMQQAKKELSQARNELQSYKKLIDQLDQDGLINKNSSYNISIKEGSLMINGTTQPDAIYQKYQHLFPDRKNITIKKDEDGLNIKNDRNQ